MGAQWVTPIDDGSVWLKKLPIAELRSVGSTRVQLRLAPEVPIRLSRGQAE